MKAKKESTIPEVEPSSISMFVVVNSLQIAISTANGSIIMQKKKRSFNVVNNNFPELTSKILCFCSSDFVESCKERKEAFCNSKISPEFLTTGIRSNRNAEKIPILKISK
jgi:hypothetical protein